MALTLSRDTLYPALRAIALGARRAVERALEREAEAIMTEAKLLCPVDTGALRGTGRVEPTAWFGNTAVSRLTFGDPMKGVDYTEPVHERLDVRHASPTQAKFLEAPINGSRFGFMNRIETDVQQWLDKQAGI